MEYTLTVTIFTFWDYHKEIEAIHDKKTLNNYYIKYMKVKLAYW